MSNRNLPVSGGVTPPEYVVDYSDGMGVLIEVPVGTGGEPLDRIHFPIMSQITDPDLLREVEAALAAY